MAVQKLGEPTLVPSSMDATNMTVDASHKIDGALPGSDGVVPLPGSPGYDPGNQTLNVPALDLSGPVQPVNPQAGHYGGKGLPTEPTREEMAKVWTTGIQGGGNQGSAGGDSGPDLWKATPSSSA